MQSSLPETRRKALFLHSFIDEMGLRPVEFRIYAHLCRRAGENGHAFPGIRSIAETCRIDKTSVAPAIEGLIARGLVRIEKGPRNANIYILTEPCDWVANPDSQSSESSGSLSEKSPSTVRNDNPVTVRKITTQGNPRNNPKKEIKGGKAAVSWKATEEEFRDIGAQYGLTAWGITANGYSSLEKLWRTYDQGDRFKSRSHMENTIKKAVRDKEQKKEEPFWKQYV